MPINTRYKLTALDEPQFQELDYAVMGVAYGIQNDFGRLFSENTYKQEMADRLVGILKCDLEERITVSHKEFVKTLFMDCVVEQGLICEIKVAIAITAEHEAQLLQYMMLTGASRGKIINFGESSVEGKLISTELTHALRRKLAFDFDRWICLDSESETFRQSLVLLIQEIGGFLTLSLYYEGITCLLGGQEKIIRPVQVLGNNRVIASQNCHLLNPTTAFKLTSLTSKAGINAFRTQLKKFLTRTDLDAIQWVNLNHHDVKFETVKKNSSKCK